MSIQSLRKPRGPQTHNVTREECETLIARAVKAAVEDTTIKICEFYLSQVPEMVIRMVQKVMAAQGQELKPPPSPDAPSQVDGPAETIQ